MCLDIISVYTATINALAKTLVIRYVLISQTNNSSIKTEPSIRITESLYTTKTFGLDSTYLSIRESQASNNSSSIFCDVISPSQAAVRTDDVIVLKLPAT